MRVVLPPVRRQQHGDRLPHRHHLPPRPGRVPRSPGAVGPAHDPDGRRPRRRVRDDPVLRRAAAGRRPGRSRPTACRRCSRTRANDKTLAATGGPLHDVFYGAFLDINQPPGVFPAGGTVPAGNADGPWPPGSGVSLEPSSAAFIRNEHQCLMAEIAFDPAPDLGRHPAVATPTSWPSGTSRGAPSRTRASTSRDRRSQTFEVRPTPSASVPARRPTRS